MLDERLKGTQVLTYSRWEASPVVKGKSASLGLAPRNETMVETKTLLGIYRESTPSRLRCRILSLGGSQSSNCPWLCSLLVG